jgi:5'-nucleotidase
LESTTTGHNIEVRALITNDDGVDSPGLAALAEVALRADLDVTVAAPSWDSSGASASITSVEQDGRFLVEERPPPVEGTTWYAVEAPPAFIVWAGMGEAFGPKPDVVLSGINTGPNLGGAVLHSGTVGAVLTAATQQCRGMAVSLGVGGPFHWETAAEMASRLLPWLLEAPPATTLNLNVPNVPLDQVRGLRRGGLATGGTVQATVTELDGGYRKMSYAQGDGEAEPDSDAALLAAGYACFTPLVAPCEAMAVDTSDLA